MFSDWKGTEAIAPHSQEARSFFSEIYASCSKATAALRLRSKLKLSATKPSNIAGVGTAIVEKAALLAAAFVWKVRVES